MRAIEPYTFRTAQEQWSRPPVDNVGYIPSEKMLAMSDEELLGLMETFRGNRYSLEGWRNHKGLWRELLGLDTTEDKVVLDFGCGVGIESLEFARKGNKVILADITHENIELARRVLRLYGQDPFWELLVREDYPFFDPDYKGYDVFYANGVLHHTPLIREILLRAVEDLAPDGEIRVMLYSDKGWKIATSQGDPDPHTKACDSPRYQRFVAFFDGVGYYADWFSREKLEYLLGDFLSIDTVSYITKDGRYLVATMSRRQK